MSLLTNWDDLVHGTLVFSAAVPLCVGLLLGWILPARQLWIAVAAGVGVPVFWFFGVPGVPPGSSDDAVAAAWVLAVLLTVAGTAFAAKPWLRVTLRFLLWFGLAWLLYPAWLAEDGGASKKWLLSAGVGASIAGWAELMEILFRTKEENFRLTPAALLPPSVAIAVLLQLGGALQFGQAAGALAAAVGAVCLLTIRSPSAEATPPIAAFWGMLFGLLAWSGWLFAEIHKVAAMVLVAAPLLALAARWLPLPRKNAFLVQLWDGLASAVVAAAAVWLAWAEYSAASGGNEGY